MRRHGALLRISRVRKREHDDPSDKCGGKRHAREACPLCGGIEREVQARRGGWEIAQCTRCEMVFLGSELAYDEQAKNHDWVEEHTRELAQRREKQPRDAFSLALHALAAS